METYAFKVGEFDCLSLSGGISTRDMRQTFPRASMDELARAVEKYGTPVDAVPSSMNILLVKTPQHRVLIDTGTGTGKLVENLRAGGVDPAEVDMVFITHGHWDHINGITDEKGQFIFGNARYMMSLGEWEHWTAESTVAKLDETRKESIRRNLIALKNRIELIDGEAEIVPGIRALDASGHTLHHTGVTVESNGERLYDLVDAMHHPVQMQYYEWGHPADIQPDRASDTRRRLTARAAHEKALLIFYHFAFPGLGRVVDQDGGFMWKPL